MVKIFVSGISGFIGSHLTEKLLEENYEVYGLCRRVTDRVPNLPKDINIVWGDIIDGHFLKHSIRHIKPEIVIHLAAPSSVAFSHTHPQENFEVTVMGTMNLQKACENLYNLEKFIFAGTSEEYGNQKELPIRETAQLFPNQPYAIAKVAADHYLNYCKDSIGFPSVIMRPFNTYGRRKNFTFVTETIVHQMLTKDKILLGDPSPIRDLMYVDDHVNAYMTALKIPYEKLEPYRAFNFCTGIGTSIGDLADTIKDLIGYTGEITWRVKQRPTEINTLIGDNSLAKKVLGWEPKYSLKEGLSLTIQKIQEALWIE